LSALTCLGRAYRQVRGAALLAHFGYYQETQALLRGAVEAGGLARILAHDPAMSERWLRKGDWFPDRTVRQQLSAEHAHVSAKFYSDLSKWTHPTAEPCLMGLIEREGGYEVMLTSRFDADGFEFCLRLVLTVTVWLCFAFRNSVANPLVLPPEWLQELADLAHDANPEGDWSHVQRMKDAVEQRWRSIAEKTGTDVDLESALRSRNATFNMLDRLGIEPLDPDEFRPEGPPVEPADEG
jgi:hypothetical protein